MIAAENSAAAMKQIAAMMTVDFTDALLPPVTMPMSATSAEKLPTVARFMVTRFAAP